MRLLACGVSFCQDWARLAETELELAKQPLALAHAQFNSVSICDPRREGFAIPEIDPAFRRRWALRATPD